MNLTELDTEKESLIIPYDLVSEYEEAAFTYLHCTYTTSPKYDNGWWVNIHRECYLTSIVSKDELLMINAIGIPLSPDRHYLQRRGDSITFTLIFPAIPKNWILFDLEERGATTPTIRTRNVILASGSLSIRNIQRNDTGVYHVRIY